MCKFVKQTQLHFFMKTNQDFKNQALGALKGNWTQAALVSIIYMIIVGLYSGPLTYQIIETQSYIQTNAGSPARVAAMLTDPEYLALSQRTHGVTGLSTLLFIMVILPLVVGLVNAFHRLLVRNDTELVANTLHLAFSNYWHKVWGMLWMYILTVLWSFLLIIPGIIKAFSYAMTPYILEDCPELTATEAIHRSRMMMHGHKFDLFWLYLSFIGWWLLSILTLGIGFIWLMPYMQTAAAGFYEEVKAEYEQNGGLD